MLTIILIFYPVSTNDYKQLGYTQCIRSGSEKKIFSEVSSKGVMINKTNDA